MAAGDAVDVVVVGGGTAGCVVAARLVLDHQLTVVLIERGAATSNPHPLDLFESMSRPGAVTFTPVSFVDSVRDYVTGSILGGGSAVNGLVVMTGDADDYDDWESEYGAFGWNWEQVAPAFVSLDVVPENANRRQIGPVGKALLRAGVNAQPVTVAVHRGQRVSSDSAYIADARETGRLRIIDRTTVTRVLHRDGEVEGVECADGSVVSGCAVVIAAGALVTPRILAGSGLSHPELGQGLQDHPSFMFPIRPSAVADLASPASAIARISSGVAGSRPLDGQLIAYEYIDPSRQWAGVSVMLVDVYSRGSIDVADPAGRIDIGALTDDRDVRAMRELVRTTVRMLVSGDFGDAFCDAEGTPAPHLLGLDDDDLDEWIRRSVTPLSHASCTCAMGTGKPLDENGRVRGTRGLWVADSSAMPRITRGNTNLPTTMIAWRISGFLGESLRASRR